MTDAQYKVLENRLRRMAQRQGFRLVKSRRRDPRAIDFGCYMLADMNGGRPYGCAPYGAETGMPRLSLDEVEKYLTDTPRTRSKKSKTRQEHPTASA